MAITQSLIVTVVLVAVVPGLVHSSINQDFFRSLPEPSTPSPPPPPTPPPCRKAKLVTSGGKQAKLIPADKFKLMGGGYLDPRNFDSIQDTNCSDGTVSSDGTSVQPVLYDHWKLHIIMACTVTAAVEFVLIIFIILYWRQIRWTLRKITCPRMCCHGDRHEAMDPEGEGSDNDRGDTSDDLDFGTIHLEPRRLSGDSVHMYSEARVHMYSEGRVQVYSAPRTSRVTSAADDEPVPGPSGLSPSRLLQSPSRMLHRPNYGSSSEESLVVVETIAQRPPSGKIKGAKGKKADNDCDSKTLHKDKDTTDRSCTSQKDCCVELIPKDEIPKTEPKNKIHSSTSKQKCKKETHGAGLDV